MNNYSAEPGKPVLIIFARDPVPGQVKTRLIPQLGTEGACALHRRLLQRTLHTALQCSGTLVEIWTDTSNPSAEIAGFAHYHGIKLRKQKGYTLGDRMHHALDDALHRSDRAILIGSDCPDWQVADLEQALALLQEQDVVIAPAHDGGYVLIGCRRNAVELFSDIHWGSDQVFTETIARLENLGWSWHELPSHPDIDTQKDLELVPELL